MTMLLFLVCIAFTLWSAVFSINKLEKELRETKAELNSYKIHKKINTGKK